MILEQFNKQYKYKSDKEKFNTSLDIWEILKPNKDGLYEGDCESYCITLKNKIPKFEDWDLYYCKLNGVGHCVLSNGAMIIDCNCKETILKEKYMEKYRITGFKKYNRLVVFSKYIFAKVFLFFKKGN